MTTINPNNLHILNRFGFGPKIEWLKDDSKKKLLSDQELLIDWILNTIPQFEPCSSYFSKNLHFDESVISKEQWRKRWPSAAQRADWIETMVNLDNPIREKLALFWNHVIPISVGIWPFAQDLLLDAFRENATSNYATLLIAVSESPCAMKFLNSYHSQKDKPNQNFPRELLEIFTVGPDNYSQQDVIELSRAFTGRRTVHPDTFAIPYPYKMYIDYNQFDNGIKTILGKTGNWDGRDAIKILVDQKNTANLLATKFLKFFVSDNPEKHHLEELTNFIYHNAKFDIIEIVEFILRSSWFYNSKYLNTKVKTPVELWVGYQRSLGMRTANSEIHNKLLQEFGQNVLFPQNVGGWPWGKNWLNGNLLLKRFFLPKAVLDISQNQNIPEEMSTGDKIIYRTYKSNLLGFRYDFQVSFKKDVFHEIIKNNNINLNQWLLNQNTNDVKSLDRIITCPQFQLN